MASIRRFGSAALTSKEIEKLRSLLWQAFGVDPEDGFTEDDWSHALGGWHVLAEDRKQILAHASLVPRTLEVDGKALDTGYVEAVATDPSQQNKGIATDVMRAVGDLINEHYQLGALGTGSFHFYERLGWRRWQGPTGVRTASGTLRTPDDDPFIMVLLTKETSHLDLGGFITCDWRQGDVW